MNFKTIAAFAVATAFATPVSWAQDTIKVGVIAAFSGPFADYGKQMQGGIKAWMAQHGDKVAGKKIQLIYKDTTGPSPEIAKRLAQELVVREKVDFLAGFGLTPEALAVAPIAQQAKKPMIIMNAATSVITTKSDYIARFSMTLPQISAPMGDWALKNNIKNVATVVADYGPGIDAEKAFSDRLVKNGGKIVEAIRVPLRNPEFAPFIQRIKDAKPDAVFVFVPSGEGAAVLKQFTDRGLAAAGIRLIATGDVLDDDLMPSIGNAALGVVSSHHYSAAHPSPENKAFVAAFTKANKGMRPNFHAVGAYDGMQLLYAALKKTKGDSTGPKLVEAMKGMAWTSVRGPVSIDPATRDIVQTVYIRKAEQVDGGIYNVEFDKVEKFKDPGVE